MIIQIDHEPEVCDRCNHIHPQPGCKGVDCPFAAKDTPRPRVESSFEPRKNGETDAEFLHRVCDHHRNHTELSTD